MGDDTAKAEQAAQVLRTVEFVLTALALLILLVVAINLAQTFTLLLRHRRREIGSFRSLGATKSDIRRVILWEASLIGLFGSILGALGGLGASILIDLCLGFIPYFPYKPRHPFLFQFHSIPPRLWCSSTLLPCRGTFPLSARSESQSSRSFIVDLNSDVPAL